MTIKGGPLIVPAGKSMARVVRVRVDEVILLKIVFISTTLLFAFILTILNLKLDIITGNTSQSIQITIEDRRYGARCSSCERGHVIQHQLSATWHST